MNYDRYYRQTSQPSGATGGPQFHNGMGVHYANGQVQRLRPGDTYHAPGGGGYSYQRTVTGREGMGFPSSSAPQYSGGMQQPMAQGQYNSFSPFMQGWPFAKRRLPIYTGRPQWMPPQEQLPQYSGGNYGLR